MAKKHYAKFGLSHRNVAHVGHPQHQRWYSVKRGDDGSSAMQFLPSKYKPAKTKLIKDVNGKEHSGEAWPG
jgi:hypothetical protein